MTLQPWCQGRFLEFSKTGRQLCIEKENQIEWRSKITLWKQWGEQRAGFKARWQLLGSPRQSGLREHNALADGLTADGRVEDTNCNSPRNLPFSAPSLLPWPWLGMFSSSSGFKSSSIRPAVLVLHTCYCCWMCRQVSLSSMEYDPLLLSPPPLAGRLEFKLAYEWLHCCFYLSDI